MEQALSTNQTRYPDALEAYDGENLEGWEDQAEEKIDPEEAEAAAKEARDIASTLRLNGVEHEALEMEAMALQLEAAAKKTRWMWFQAALMAQRWVRGRRGKSRTLSTSAILTLHLNTITLTTTQYDLP